MTGLEASEVNVSLFAIASDPDVAAIGSATADDGLGVRGALIATSSMTLVPCLEDAAEVGRGRQEQQEQRQEQRELDDGLAPGPGPSSTPRERHGWSLRSSEWSRPPDVRPGIASVGGVGPAHG